VKTFVRTTCWISLVAITALTLLGTNVTAALNSIAAGL